MLTHAICSQRAVDSAGKEAADLDVGDLMGAHGLIKGVLDDVGPFLDIFRLVDFVSDLVEATFADVLALDDHEVPGQNLMHALEHGLRVVQILETQVLRQHLLVH